MGKSYPAGGAEQGLAILRDLASHPATARHVATKLARHFAADDPPASLVERLERAFLDSDGDLPTVYRALVEAPEPWAAAKTKVRSPWDWTVAAMRASGIDSIPRSRSASTVFNQLAQPVWRPQSPAGWGDLEGDWIGPAALLARVELAERSAAAGGPASDPVALAEQVLADALSAATREAIAEAGDAKLGLALMLSSPEFMRR
jgi:uncharacterized protein (DUF1800 family)